MPTSPRKQFIAYYRVSTERQGMSGLGLEAQREAIASYLTHVGGTLAAEYTEIESGKRKDRPQLLAALAECRRSKSVLVIAKLDRLARNVAVIANLIESGVEFVACDNPHANRLMLHLLAAFAEHEREMISERTKAALAAARARGVRLGSYATVLAAKSREQADEFATTIREEFAAARREGATNAAAIARRMNEKGIRPPREGQWHAKTVIRIEQRLARLEGC